MENTKKEFNWNYLRLTFGQRKFFFQDQGFFIEYSVGFNGLLPVNYHRDDQLYPGIGAGFGLGFSSKYFSVGANLNGSFTVYSESALTPIFYVGLNFPKKSKPLGDEK